MTTSSSLNHSYQNLKMLRQALAQEKTLWKRWLLSLKRKSLLFKRGRSHTEQGIAPVTRALDLSLKTKTCYQTFTQIMFYNQKKMTRQITEGKVVKWTVVIAKMLVKTVLSMINRQSKKCINQGRWDNNKEVLLKVK
jgi:hypothetical protein